MTTARDFFAVLLLIAAMILGALWLPAVWFSDHVVDEDGFLEITQPLADDPELQRTLTDSAVEEILEGGNVPGWLAERVTPVLQEQSNRLTDTDGYGTLWDVTMVELHGALFTPGASDLDVDLAPVIDSVLTGVEDNVPLVEIPRPDSATITLARIPDVPLLTHATALTPWAPRLGPIALVLAVLALVIAAHRRTMVTLAGIGAICAGFATLTLSRSIDTVVPDRVDQATFLGPIVQVFEEQFRADLLPQSVIMLGAGALVAATGLVLVGLRRRS